MHSDDIIEKALRHAVRSAMRLDEDVTVNSVRTLVAKELDLEEDFFKSSSTWKTKSKEIINAAFEEASNTAEDSSPPARAGTKRRSTGPVGPAPKKAKRQADAVIAEKENEDIDRKASPDVKAPRAAQDIAKQKKPAEFKSNTKKQRRSDSRAMSDDSDVVSAHSSVEQEVVQEDDDNDSDMSVLIDSTPPKKRQRKKKATSPPPTKRQPKVKSTAEPLSAEAEQIKTLQSQLVKCGVKKLWHRELAAYEQPQDKIRHLKSMLADVGMTGRFSAEKAEQIKEARELAADMESAKDFQKKWGADGDTGRGRRRRATKNLAIDEDSDEDAASVVEAGAATGLVDFGDSGESDW